MRAIHFFALTLSVLFGLSLALAPQARARTAKKAPKAEQPEEKQEEKKEEPAAAKPADKVDDAKKESKAAASVEKEPAAKKVSYSRRSPALAGGLAVFPGMLVHGTGHLYAGSWVKGLGLMAVEGAAVGVIVANISTLSEEAKRFGDGQIPTNFSHAFTVVGVSVVAATAFLYTWFDDMAGAPIAAAKYNQRMEMKASRARLRLAPTHDLAGLGFSLSKEF